ncbi:hypothetical protein LN650_29880 [Klebsiella pneumoniae subsp. pneumoniae]|nr:hypothetical protein [Klebsiella pneumoniae subsp. pneumoniae]
MPSRVVAFRLRAGWRLRLYPAYKRHWTHHYTGSVGPRKRSAAGHGPSQGAACMPGGGYALPGLQMALDPPLHWIRRPARA